PADVLRELLRLQPLLALQALLPAPQLLDIVVAGAALQRLLIANVVDADPGPLARVPVRDVHAGIETDALQVDAGVERLHALFHRHAQPGRAMILIAARLGDGDGAVIALPGVEVM